MAVTTMRASFEPERAGGGDQVALEDARGQDDDVGVAARRSARAA